MTVGEFTIRAIRTSQELDLACRFLLGIFPSLEGGWRGPGFFHERLADESPMMLAAKREEAIAGVVLGHVDGDGLGTVDHLAVAAAARGAGLGRGLLSALESGARGLRSSLTSRCWRRSGRTSLSCGCRRPGSKRP